HIARARVDPQQVCRSSHDDAEGPVGAGPLGQIPDVVEFGDTESLVQPASRGCDLLLRNRRCSSLSGITCSRISRRQDPTHRSATPFCQGACTLVCLTFKPVAFKKPITSASCLESRSKMA